MTTTFPLPLECLQLIIHKVALNTDAKTLAALLRVNKYVRSATLPILYNNPFSFLPFQFYHHSKHDVAALLKLMKTLLLSLPAGQVTDLLQATYFQSSTDLQLEISVPYYSFVTTIDFRQFTPLHGSVFHRDSLGDCAGLNDHLERSGRVSRYLAEEVVCRLKNVGQHETITYAAGLELRRDFTWALCANAERIQNIAIPISDIDRYLAIVSRFKVLSNVIFFLDRNIRPVLLPILDLTPEDKDILTVQQSDRIRHLEGMISFVQEHRRVHSKVLTQGRCDKGEHAIGCPTEYQHRLVQALPPLVKPHFIDNRNWTQFVAKVQDTDLSCIQNIQFQDFLTNNDSLLRRDLDRLIAQGPFLHRCRSLENLDLGYLGDDAFQWAVDERKQYDADIAGGCTPQRLLVPLRHFCVSGLPPSLGRQIDDVGYAFQDTLETINIRSLLPSDSTGLEMPEFSIGALGSSWNLPRLSRLHARVHDAGLTIHPDFIQRCPQLTFMTLSDRRQRYLVHEVVHWKPAVLSHLRSVWLKGSPALSFHPDTLKHTPDLIHLSLNLTPVNRDYFIPPVEEFEDNEQGEMNGSEEDGPSLMSLRRPPVWTWDWELPKLRSLRLTGPFAYRFQFKVLNGTPSLDDLSVDSNSVSRLHERSVSLADLLKPGSQHSPVLQILEKERQQHRPFERQQHWSHLPQLVNLSTDDINSTDDSVDDELVSQDMEFLHAPALKTLTLFGEWRMDKHVLDILFGKVAPGLNVVFMTSCLGHKVSDWISSTSRNLPGVRTAMLKTDVRTSSLTDAGLEAVNDDRAGVYYTLVEPPAGRIVATPTKYTFRQ
ncbi:MAG: hypothetical protein J3R72DRAFT_436078 [Linnemannia gamsii]|nr:MAG: hypothetical protein J3R72DRAFT_436078 [Linnemannia gamsii]